MAQREYLSEAGPYVEAMRTVRGAKNLFFALLTIVLLFLAASFCFVRYAAVLQGDSGSGWDNFLSWAFPFFTFLGVVVSCLYVLTLLVGLKISLAGRLDGVAGLTKGFFWALFFLAILVPWQHILIHTVSGQEVRLLRIVPGVVYGLDELKQEAAPAGERSDAGSADEEAEPSAEEVQEKDEEDVSAQQQAQTMKEVLLAVRFLVYPLGALLLLVVAQSKYKPQRVEMPEPVKITRLTSTPPEPKQTSE